MEYPHQDCHPPPPPPAPPLRLPNQTLAEHHYELLDWSAKFIYWQASQAAVGNGIQGSTARAGKKSPELETVLETLVRIEGKLDRVMAKNHNDDARSHNHIVRQHFGDSAILQPLVDIHTGKEMEGFPETVGELMLLNVRRVQEIRERLGLKEVGEQADRDHLVFQIVG